MTPEERIQLRLEELVSRSNAEWANQGDMLAWATNILTVARQLLGSQHFQVKLIEEMITNFTTLRSYQGNFVRQISGVAQGLQSDFIGGHLHDIRSQIRSEVEVDFISIAYRFLEDGLKDPSAMLLGAVLEDSLRHLCQKNNIPETNNIESMNTALRTNGVYSLPQQHQVTAWAAIRNKAAHGRFDNYDIQEVRLMHQGMLDFIKKYLD